MRVKAHKGRQLEAKLGEPTFQNHLRVEAFKLKRSMITTCEGGLRCQTHKLTAEHGNTDTFSCETDGLEYSSDS